MKYTLKINLQKIISQASIMVLWLTQKLSLLEGSNKHYFFYQTNQSPRSDLNGIDYLSHYFLTSVYKIFLVLLALIVIAMLFMVINYLI